MLVSTYTTANIMLFPSIATIKYVGAFSSASAKLTEGSLDDVRIYNRALSASEISQIYNATKSKYGY